MDKDTFAICLIVVTGFFIIGVLILISVMEECGKTSTKNNYHQPIMRAVINDSLYITSDAELILNICDTPSRQYNTRQYNDCLWRTASGTYFTTRNDEESSLTVTGRKQAQLFVKKHLKHRPDELVRVMRAYFDETYTVKKEDKPNV